MTTLCQVCESSIKNGYVCPKCSNQLEQALGDVDALIDELQTTAHRLDKTTRPGNHHGGKSEHPPMPVNFHATDASRNLNQTLLTWSRYVANTQGREHLKSFQAGDLASYLLWHRKWITTNEAAGQMHTEIMDAVAHANRAIDLPPDRKNAIYAGPCGHVENGVTCTQQLWAARGQDRIRCRVCGTEWDVDQRRTAALYAAEDELVTASTATKALSAHGIALNVNTIKSWRRRGWLEYHGIVAGGFLYRLGDLLDLVSQVAQARTHREGA